MSGTTLCPTTPTQLIMGSSCIVNWPTSNVLRAYVRKSLHILWRSATIVTQCHDMDEFIGACWSFIPKSDAIMQQTNLCIADFEMLFWTLWTCANHSESFVTWSHCAWRMILWRKTFRPAIPAPQLCRTLKTLATLIMLFSNNARFE